MTERATRREIAAGADWVRDYAEWRGFWTLTFAEPVTRPNAWRILREFLRSIARFWVRSHFKVLIAIEEHASGAPHFHVLIDVNVGKDAVNKAWKHDPSCGFTEIRAYDPARGAAAYVVKERNWTAGVMCPRLSECRRKRCLVASPPVWGD
jgi:hypothetical protein